MRTYALLRRRLWFARGGLRWSLWPALALAGLNGCTPARDDLQHLVLPSGDSVRILLITRLAFSDGSPDALQLVYRSDKAVDDTVALRKQAEEVWPAFRPVVEGQALDAAVLTADLPSSATHVRAARVWTGTRHGFVVRKHPDGQWRLDGDTMSLPR